MKNSKKVLSGVLAVLMLVSMLACFVLPAAADGATTLEDCYYVSTASEWNALADKIAATGNYGASKTIYILKDIDFTETDLTQIATFAGTLDGNGYKFTNITMSASGASFTNYSSAIGLIGTLTGTIQNLTLADSCSFTNNSSLYIGSATVKLGAFAATANGGTIRKCASYATCTTEQESAVAGGFVGTATGATTIDGCIFDGAISNASGTAGAFIGTPGDETAINYSIARGSLTAATSASDAAYFGTNSYAIVAEDGSYGTAENIKTDLNEAVWFVNEAIDAAKAADPTMDLNYLNVDSSGIPCFGDANNRVVRLATYAVDAETPTYTYHAPRSVINSSTTGQTRINAYVSGQTAVVEGAEYHDGYIYVGSSDITLTYMTASEDYVVSKAQLQAMVDAYEQMDSAYFTDWAPIKAWLTNAEDALSVELADNATATEKVYYNDRLQSCISAEEQLEGYVVAMTEPEDYPSVLDYNIYKYVDGIKGYKIASKEDWSAAVAMSNYVENPDAVNFEGVTLHLAADINMASTEMKPLCYGWFFDGNLDGHDHVFQNINITVDSPYGPVGLIGVLGKTEARTVQNVGIESGSIKVTGLPRFKANSSLMNITDSTNIVGGIVGKNCYANSLIRKCWNGADISVENGDNVAGIIGAPRTHGIIDSCFNLGQTTAYGLHGYGYQTAKVSNSMSGPVQSSAVDYRARIYLEALGEGKNNIANICGVKSTLAFSNYSGDSVVRADAVAFKDDFNEANTEFSNAAAAWKVNENYADQGYGERVYYTLNDNGDVRFGNAENQICRIEMVCECDKDENGECADHPIRYAYGVAGRPLELNFDFGANYYACEEADVTIKDNTLVFESAPKAKDETKENNFTVYVDYDADRGDVIADDEINVLDVLKVVRMVVDSEMEKDLLTADVDSDHAVTVKDAYQIIRYVFGGQEKACFTPGNTAEKEDDYLKVLSYNVKGLYYDPNTTANDSSIGTALSRKNAVLAELNAVDADIMGFQELIEGHSLYTGGADALEEIYNGLSWTGGVSADDHMHYASTRTYSSGGTAGCGIISKYPILGSETVFFADEERSDGDLTKRLDDTTGTPRAFTWYQIDLNDNGEYDQGTDIIFYNTHLAIATVPGTSAAQLEYIVEYMNTKHANDRVVGVGDFNLAAYKMKEITTNTGITALNGGENFNTYVATNSNSGSMVDNILVNGNMEYYKSAENKLTTTTGLSTRVTLYDSDQAVTSDETLGWTASDHLPIWAYIKLNPSA